MAVPDFQSLMLPMLDTLTDGRDWTMRDLTGALADRFNLSEDDRQQLLPSGGSRVIVNRVAWAKTHLQSAGLLRSVRRGVVQLTDEGKQVLATGLPRVDVKFLRTIPAYRAWIEGTDDEKEEDVKSTRESPETPEELMAKSYLALREALARELLQQVLECSDKFFEKLVVDLLVAMGYGGTIEDAGEAVGKSGDGGIDGVIKEDRLGLDIVVLQAKRWTGNPVGRPDVQAFAGSMEAYRANKGVFITTSTFSEPAKDYVKQIQRRIVLIDGKTLAGLMIDHGIGVTAYRSYTLKRLDSDYFEQ